MSDNLINWQESKLVIPYDAVNYALLENGSRATASSCSQGFEAMGTINGMKSLQDWGSGNGWKSAPVSWHPNWWGEWIQIDFLDETLIDTIVIYSFPQMVIERLWSNLKHFQVQYLDKKDEWITFKTIRDNRDDYTIISFDKALVQTIRIWINRNHFREEGGYENSCNGADEAPRILEIEAYCLNSKIILENLNGEKVVENGEKGNVGIFYDPNFENKTAVDIEKLTSWVKDWGYSVTYLTAEELCIKEIFSKQWFDIFIHPYGKYLPVGTNIYNFLQQGGHLITFGGRAFTVAKQKIDNKWIDIGMDPAVTVSKARYIDYMRPYREQLGMFTVPGSILEDVAFIKSNRNQAITHGNIKIQGSIEGWMSLGVVGEVLPIDETRHYAHEGRMPLINHTAREGINRAKADTPILWGEGQDENYGSIFAYPCARWIPIINCFDRFGRNRGPVAAFMPHYEGVYRGSHWLYFGVEDVDVLQWDNIDRVISDVFNFLHIGIVAHSLEPSYSCYRQGEVIDFSIIIDNFSDSSHDMEMRFSIFDSSESSNPLYVQVKKMNLIPKTWKRLDFSWESKNYNSDFYKIKAAIFIDGCEVDVLENGFTIWTPSVLLKGPKVEFKDNYFHFEGKARYVTGARDSGLHMPWQPEENPLGWEKQYNMLRDFGMQVTSPVHMDWCIPGLGWGDFDYVNPIPEIILRRLDAQVQIAQKYQLIYAPCIFFTYEKVAMKKPNVARRICEVLGERYKDVPGVMFYIFDDGLRHDPDIFNKWAKECVDGFNSSGRKYIVTAEMGFRQTWPDTMRRSAKHLTFSSGSNFRQSVGDPVYERLVDLRPIGKSFTLGEFVRRIPLNTPEDFHGYLAPPHVNFGMGYAMALNWKWSTGYHTIWPSDVVFPGNQVPKKHLYAYRNEALFFRLFEPVYKSPSLILVMPSVFWLKNSEAYTRYIVEFIRKLLEMKVDFACIDEEDLDLLQDTVKAIILPLPLELSEHCYSRVKEFTLKGGKTFIIGDIGKNSGDIEGVGCAEWLEELCGVIRVGDANGKITKGRSLYMEQFMLHSKVEIFNKEYTALSWIILKLGRAKSVLLDKYDRPVVTQASFGAGTAWFMNDIGTEFDIRAFKGYFEEAGIQQIKIKPDSTTLHCFKLHTIYGPVYTMFTFPWDQGRLDTELESEAGKVNLVLKGQSMCIVSITQNEKGIAAVESQGSVALNGREIMETDGHMMLAALDRVDILDSSALLLLPITAGTIKIDSKTNTVESGEIVNGMWKPYTRNNCLKKDGKVEISVGINDVSVLYLIYDSLERAKAIGLIENYIK